MDRAIESTATATLTTFAIPTKPLLLNGLRLYSRTLALGLPSLKPDFTFVSYGARLRVAYLNGVCYKWLPHCDSKGIGLLYYKARLAQITNEQTTTE